MHKLTGDNVMNYRKKDRFELNSKLTKADIKTAFFCGFIWLSITIGSIVG